MTYEDNIQEWITFEVFKRVFHPVKDEIVDPGVNFDRCIKQLDMKIRLETADLPASDKQTYFFEKANQALQWCKENDAPELMLEKTQQWVNQQKH